LLCLIISGIEEPRVLEARDNKISHAESIK
jgi:hypothetical protein